MSTRSWIALLVALLRPFDLAGQARAYNDVDSAIQVGWAILERARADDGRKFDRARDAFREAHDLAPDRAEPLLGIGLAEGGKGDWLAAEPLNIGTRVGHGAYRAAVRALIAALARDPHLTPAILEMDRVALALRDTAINQQVLMAIRGAATSGNDDPATLLILGRRERAAGQAEASIAILQRYQSSGSNASLARYELARSLLTANNEEGVQLYFAAVIADDSLVAGEVRADLVPIAERHELAEFDGTRGSARQDFLRRFWEDRARRDLRSASERLREHFRRLRFARQNYILSNNRRYYGMRDLYRAARSETLDDRGVVYLRHGEPDLQLRPLLFGLLPNETWLYRRPDGDLLMHFSAGGEKFEGGDLTDYRLVPSVLALRGDRAPKDMLIASRFEISDLYEKILAWGPHGTARAWEEERQWGEASALIGTSTDGFELKFAHPLEVNTDLVTVGRRGRNSLLQVFYALPATIPPGTPVRFRLFVFDTLGGAHAWLDSTAVSEVMGGRSGGRFELEVAPGEWRYRFALATGEAGMVSPSARIAIPDLSGSLAMTGVALGRKTENLRWVTGVADTAHVHPDRNHPAGSDLELYYEVYGLRTGATYSASVVVFEKRGNRVGRSRLRLAFQEEGQGDVTRVRRSIRLAGLEPGEYWIEVGVGDGSGRHVSVKKELRVIAVTH